MNGSHRIGIGNSPTTTANASLPPCLPPPVFIYASEAKSLKTIVHPVSPSSIRLSVGHEGARGRNPAPVYRQSIIGKILVELQVTDLVRRRSVISSRSVHIVSFVNAEEQR